MENPQEFYMTPEVQEARIKGYKKMVKNLPSFKKDGIGRKILNTFYVASALTVFTLSGNYLHDSLHNPVVLVKPSYDEFDEDLFLEAEFYANSQYSPKELSDAVKRHDTDYANAYSQYLKK